MPFASSPSSKRMSRFICDEQLGRLAKWLRLQGYDTLYECPVSDARLIQLAQSKERILLTRDRHLPAKTIWPSVVIIEKTNYLEQLRELRKKIKLPRANPFSRCLDCNEEIQEIARINVKNRTPDEVYRTYQDFYTCPGCQKIFWQGSHVRASWARLQRIRK